MSGRPDLDIPEEALNRIHHTINESRQGSEFIKVRREDLKAVLYAAAKLAAKGEARIQ